jgi:hypothetical protein
MGNMEKCYILQNLPFNPILYENGMPFHQTIDWPCSLGTACS